MKIKNSISIYLAFSVLIFCTFCDAALSIAGEKVVAKVNKATIDEKALAAEISKKIPYSSFHSRVSKKRLQQIRTQALETLINEELLYQEALRQKLTVSQEQIKRQIQMMQKGFPSKEAFDKALAKTGMNERKLQHRIRRQLLIKKVLQKEVFDKVVVNDSVLRNYYNTNKKKFILPERFKVRHILISVNPGAMKEGWQEGLKKAEQIHARLVAGENFAKIAKEVSDDTTSNQQGGDIGWFHKGQLLPELEDALSKLKMNEMSQPIRTIYGYHIIKLEGVQPAKQLSFDEIDRDALKKKLIRKKIQDQREKLLQELKARADIRIFDS